MAAIRECVVPLQKVGKVHHHLKVIRVQTEENQIRSTCLHEASASNDSISIGQTASLVCGWERDDRKRLRLVNLSASDFEEVHFQSNVGRWFVDCTQTVLGQDPSERAHGMDDSVRNGLALGDANGDGLEDVYVCQGPGLPNRLLIQKLDGTVVECAASAAVDWLDQTSSALFVDLDNDRDQDLTIATSAGLVSEPILARGILGGLRQRRRCRFVRCERLRTQLSLSKR